jgi:hypothetical protein
MIHAFLVVTGEIATDCESRIERKERRAKEKAEKERLKAAEYQNDPQSEDPQNQIISIEK